MKTSKLTMLTLILPYIHFFTNNNPKGLNDIEINQTDIGLVPMD